MAATRITRRLAAIFVVDAVGYSRLMETDEMGTHVQFKSDLERFFRPRIDEHHGRIVKTTGDGLLAEFASVVDAVQCADAVQGEIGASAGAAHPDRPLTYRIGIHLGDIMIDEGDIYGDDVNIAARLEQMAEPGGVSISREVYRSVHRRLDFDFEDTGEHHLKNITEPMRVYRVVRRSKPGETSRAAAQATTAAMAPADATRPSNGLHDPAIVVLPFENLSGDPQQEYFCDGLTNDITTDLSKFANLLVIAANSGIVCFFPLGCCCDCSSVFAR